MIHVIKNITQARKIKCIKPGDSFDFSEIKMDPEADAKKLAKQTENFDKIVDHCIRIPVKVAGKEKDE